MSAWQDRLRVFPWASRKGQNHLGKDLTAKKEKQVQELRSTSLKRVTNAAEVVVFHLDLGQGGQNECRKEGSAYLCLSVCPYCKELPPDTSPAAQ